MVNGGVCVEECKMIELLIGPVVSFAIMIITLCFQNASNKRNLKEQRNQFEKSFRAQEEYYLQNQNTINEQMRLSIMPYLMLVDNIKMYERNGNTVFRVCLKNIGKNVATEISVDYHNGEFWPLVYESGSHTASKKYYYSGYLFDNTLKCDEFGNFEVLLKCNSTGISENFIEHFKMTGKVKLSVTFADIQTNKYKQQFCFYYDLKQQAILRVETGRPVLLKS